MAESVVTTTARRKMVRARAGVEVLPIIEGMAFGDGAEVEGNIIPPTADNTSLRHELLRKKIESFKEVSETCFRYRCWLEPLELAGSKINEIALLDADGDLVAIKSFSSKGKDADMEMIFDIDDMF